MIKSMVGNQDLMDEVQILSKVQVLAVEFMEKHDM